MQHIQSVIENGSSATTVTVECHLSNSLPNIVIVGVAHRSVDEAKERIRGALASSKIPIPRKRITLNLAPADIPKIGSSLDLAMLIAIITANGMTRLKPANKTAIFGEVGLDGSIHPIRGIIGKVIAAKQLGFNSVWIPYGNLAQAQLVPDITIYTFRSVNEVYVQLNADGLPAPVKKRSTPALPPTQNDFDQITGQERAKRALIIAAAGFHNTILSGPPGSGKSMLAQALPSIMPPLTTEESMKVTHLHSLSAQAFDQIITTTPFRAPHHGSSRTAIIGGGSPPQPGEISLSHHGILFFDEFMEFNRAVIEALRQPLENHSITVGRGQRHTEFPARFLFIAATNPCPCGFNGSSKSCVCTPGAIIRYQKKISGPIMDRMDIYVDVEEVANNKILMSHNTKTSKTSPRTIIERVRNIQQRRNGKLNSQLTGPELKTVGNIHPSSIKLLNEASINLQLSARGYIRALRVARTIADIDGSLRVAPAHISEALQYRSTSS